MTQIRTGQAPPPLTREQFQERFNVRFYDPVFDAERDAIARLEVIAWEALQEGRKAPITRLAGAEFSDPTYELSVQWLDTRARLQEAQKLWSNSAAQSRVLLVCGSARNDGTCPGEVSKTWRLTELARHVVEGAGMQADVLDLSLVTSEYGRNIHPCKGC
ncbi:MAG: NADPH-dependent FMN reductase, partial [Luteimonas sp.]|nr:NADPH-dependent FMN reductase [Luteimonas sp.]